MRILQICDYYEPHGGTEHYVLNISNALENLGHRLIIAYGIQSNKTLKHENRHEYFLPALMNPEGLIDENSDRALNTIISKHHPDVAYFHNIPNYALIKTCSERLATARYIHDHRFFCPKGDKMFIIGGNTCDFPMSISCYFNTFWRGCLHPFPNISLPLIKNKVRAFKALKNIQLVVASQYMKKCLIYNDFSPSAIEVIPYFCSYDRKTAVEFNDFVFFAGRLIKQKGVRYLINSIPRWPEQLNLKIAGDGPLEKRLKSLAQKLGVSHRIEFLGSLPNSDIKKYYETCLLTAVPSIWDEPFGIVGLEAMYCQKPIVAFNVGGITDWLIDGLNGFLVKRKDVRKLADKISYLFYHKEIAEKMGKAGSKIYQDQYEKDHHLSRLIEVFEKISA
ncbi:MAG: glycosyltransferase family 4 protein [Desulfobacterales bacterium]|nr:glycosyltransferase family 4 protein [Desulfobacterales bacterium]